MDWNTMFLGVFDITFANRQLETNVRIVSCVMTANAEVLLICGDDGSVYNMKHIFFMKKISD